MKFDVWSTSGDISPVLTLLPSDSTNLDEDCEELIDTIEAASFEEAKKIYNKLHTYR